MAAKMAVYYQKYEKIFPDTGKLRGFAYQTLILLILELQTLSLLHPSDAFHASLDIFKMVSRLVADKFYKLEGAALYL